jgi:hypothetical protein
MGRFVLEAFCHMGRFVSGAFCQMGRFVFGAYVLFLGRFAALLSSCLVTV